MGVLPAINNDTPGTHIIDYFICEMPYVPGEIPRFATSFTRDHLFVEVGPQHMSASARSKTSRRQVRVIRRSPAL